MTADAGADISFSTEDVSRFAAWSADRNPLHVDPGFARQTHFGQQVVHGALTVLRAMAASAAPAGRPVRTLDIEFRNAVVVGPAYRVETGTDDGMLNFNQALFNLVKAGKVSEQEALSKASNPQALEMNFKGIFLDEGRRILQ